MGNWADVFKLGLEVGQLRAELGVEGTGVSVVVW